VTKMLAAFFIDVSRARAWGGALGVLIAVEPRLKSPCSMWQDSK
jgi:hypothetical protein